MSVWFQQGAHRFALRQPPPLRAFSAASPMVELLQAGHHGQRCLKRKTKFLLKGNCSIVKFDSEGVSAAEILPQSPHLTDGHCEAQRLSGKEGR